MWSQRLAGAIRVVPALALAASTFVSTFIVPPPPAVADTRLEAAARLQLVVKEIEILNGRESPIDGAGDMDFNVKVWYCTDGASAPCLDQRDDQNGAFQGLTSIREHFYANTGDVMPFERTLPPPNGATRPGVVGPKIGFPVYPDHPTVVQFEMIEEDGGTAISPNDHMGWVYQTLDTAENGLGIGPHRVRSRRKDGLKAGDYIVSYEIRSVPLPDLRPVNIQVREQPGTATKLVCMAVQNIEPGQVGAFEVALKVNGVVPPGGRTTVPGVPPGDFVWECVQPQLPSSGQHELSVVVDESQKIVEYNESNNFYFHPDLYVGVPAASAPSTAPHPSTAPGPSTTPSPSTTPPPASKPDLAVSAIKVNGKKPDGKDDCQDGKSDVTVLVKNSGEAQAGAFTVRLVVDGDQDHVEEQTVGDGLDAGEESQVTFLGVRLKKGTHSLTATADASTDIAEPNEDNNDLKVTARCRDDN